MGKHNQGKSTEPTDALTRTKSAIDAFQNAPVERSISAMEVVVSYIAKVGRMVHPKPAEMYSARLTRRFTSAQGHPGEQWDEKLLNAYAVRNEFLGIEEWGEALDFLSSTGVFSPLSASVTWSEFKRWQRFAHLVQEHDGLATTMQSGDWSGENAEVLKALTGIYQTSFFDTPAPPEPESERKWRADPQIARMVREGQALQSRRFSELCIWFREPPVSVQWVPKKAQDNQDVVRKLQRGGAMLEFMLPQNALQPVLLIQAQTTLQAIAAAIYADRVNGVEYRTCEMCGALFKLGAHREKKYCDREKCKNRAHQKNRRARARENNDGVLKERQRKGG